jgi:multicomponent Na+:H+ antiporter subunit G
VTTLLGWGVCGLAMLALLVAAVGIVRLPNALARQHAATKAGTLAVSLFAVGLALVVQESAWTWRLSALITVLLVTLPLASHALARAGVVEENRAHEGEARVSGE